jgi:hypothetical protein
VEFGFPVYIFQIFLQYLQEILVFPVMKTQRLEGTELMAGEFILSLPLPAVTIRIAINNIKFLREFPT